MSNIIEAVQEQITRIREQLAEIERLLPNHQGNFVIYEIYLSAAEAAIERQDVVALVRILPDLQQM
jgi:hypothetical protein